VALEFPVDPMTATLGTLPADEERWGFEIKWDGYRTLAFVQGDDVRLQSRSGRDVTATYPELGGLADGVHASTAILDGELVVLGDDGRPRFELMQRHERPAALFVFDVLRVDDHDTIGLSYEDRRHLLDQLVEAGSHWMVPTWHRGEGSALLAATGEQGLEGVMAKRLDSVYVPGRRSANWRKVKHRRRVEVVVGGYTAGEGNRSTTFGSLLVGLPGEGANDALTFAGGVGTGFDQRLLESLAARLQDLASDECPFDPAPPAAYARTARWVEPLLTATLEITEFTNDGLVRQASFVELHDPEAP
jgi:bifunctional non-homologous end joining protein LigD